MFKVIKKFADAGVCCCVNIDPILPLITDSPDHVQRIIDSCFNAGVGYVFGALLRLRSDIWERMKIILKLLNIENGIDIYKNTIYQFKEPLKPWFNVGANKSYETSVLQDLKEKVLQKSITFDFPDLIRSRHLNSNKNRSAYGGGEQDCIIELYLKKIRLLIRRYMLPDRKNIPYNWRGSLEAGKQRHPRCAMS